MSGGHVAVLGGQGAATVAVASVDGLPAMLAADPDLAPLAEEASVRVADVGPSLAQRLIVAYHVARARFEPDAVAVVGQSLGEVSALALAGCLAVDDALAVARLRAELPGRLLDGRWAMVALTRLPVAGLADGLAPGCEVACINSPEDAILAGHDDAVRASVERLGVPPANARALPVEAPYHTSLMAPVAAALADAVAAMGAQPPRVPAYSPTLGRPAETAADVRDVLARMVTTTVDWSAALHALAQRWAGCRFVDYSPSTALARFLRKNAVDLDWTSAEEART